MFVLNCSPKLREKLGIQIPAMLVLPSEPYIVVSCGARQKCSAWLIDPQLLAELHVPNGVARGGGRR